MISATCMQVPTTTTTGDGPFEAGACVASAGVVGGSGYTGALLAELLLRHPSVKLAAISSETLAGEPVQQHLPRLRTGLAFCSQAELGDVDLAFLCTPHGEAAPIAKQLLDDGVKVVDLSADFRLDAATYAAWYGEHPHPELLPGVYGLTELHRDEVAGAGLVAKSGVSGAGKTPKATTHFCSVDSDLVAYGVQSHRHYPEIAAGLADGVVKSGYGSAPSGPGMAAPPAGHAPSLTFVPHLVPLQRGISETIYVKAGTWPLPTQAEVEALYDEFYAGETFVEVCDAPPQLKDVAGTNYCRIFPHVDERAGRIVVISVIDNLMKGASGQAVQNMNAMLGLPEHEGLV
jgi:N-acetyl-gamma-glutamyl-phosphate reductase